MKTKWNAAHSRQAINQPADLSAAKPRRKSRTVAGATAAVLSLAMASTASVQAVDPVTFGPEFNIDYAGGATPDLYGRLHSPPTYSATGTNSFPLIVFLHGQGETMDYTDPANYNLDQVRYNINGLYNNTQADAFIYAPQARGKTWNAGNISNVWAGVAKIIREYRIDTTRIYVTGLSLGGGGTWASLMNYPVQAAGIPICGINSQAGGNVANLVGVPIWVFHALEDHIVDESYSRNNVNAIRLAQSLPAVSWPVSTTAPFPAADGTRHFQDTSHPHLRYTEYPPAFDPDTYHPPGTSTGMDKHAWAWVRAYHDSEPFNDGMLFEWMFAQSKTVPSLNANEKILVDFGATHIASADDHGRGKDGSNNVWNSSGYGQERILSMPMKPGLLQTTAGRQTLISAVVTDVFGGTLAVDTGTDPLLYEHNVARDAWVTPANDASAVTLTGLTPGATYRVALYSRAGDTDGAYGRNTRFTVGGQSQDVTTAQVYNNISSQIVFASVQPNANGELTVQVQPINGSRRSMLNALEITRNADEVPAWFDQAFTASTNVASYVNTTLTNNLFSDISAESEGGAWSIDGGKLKLVKPGLATGNTGAGFTRYAVPAAGAPDVMELSFKIAVSNVTGSMDMGVLDTGHMSTFQDYNNTTPSPATTNRLTLKAGGTNLFKFVLNTTSSVNLAADGTEHTVSWMLNQSGTNKTYTGYDNAQHTVSSGCSDLWVNDTKLLSNVPKNAVLTGTKFAGFRLRIPASVPVTLKFDDFLMYDGLPQ